MKASTPAPVGQERDVVMSWRLFLIEEIAAEYGLDAERVEQVGRDNYSRQALPTGTIAAVEIIDPADTGDLLEALAEFSQGQKLRG